MTCEGDDAGIDHRIPVKGYNFVAFDKRWEKHQANAGLVKPTPLMEGEGLDRIFPGGYDFKPTKNQNE